MQIQVTFLPRRTFIHRLKGKGSLSWVLLLKRVSYQRNCGAASVDEYNKIYSLDNDSIAFSKFCFDGNFFVRNVDASVELLCLLYFYFYFFFSRDFLPLLIF